MWVQIPLPAILSIGGVKMVKKKKDQGVPLDKIYSSIQLTKEPTKPISFRVDGEVYRKITVLEKALKESKSVIIKNAIEKAFSHLIHSFIHNKLFEINKELFDKIKVEDVVIISAVIREEDRKHPFSGFETSARFESEVTYNLGYPEYEDNQKNFYCLNRLYIQLITEGGKTAKLKVAALDVINGNPDKIDPKLFIKIPQVAGNGKMNTETSSDKKGNISMDIFFERIVTFDMDKWSKDIKKDLQKFKKIISRIDDSYSKNNDLKIKKE